MQREKWKYFQKRKEKTWFPLKSIFLSFNVDKGTKKKKKENDKIERKCKENE